MGVRERYVDRGPAWISALCTSLLIGIHYGILNCGSLYYPGMTEAFGYPISVVSWLVTGQFAIAFCFAPFYNRILDVVPHRIAACAAAALTSVGIIGATFLHNYFAFMVPYMIVGRIGLGISIVRVLAIMAEYFDHYRVLALALASAGTGLGTFVYSALGSYLIETYTWRVALMIIGLLHLNVIPLTLALRPLPSDSFGKADVLVADHPDLTTMTVDARTDPFGSSLFISKTSIPSEPASVISISQSVRNKRTDEETPVCSDPCGNLKVIIEFVKVARNLVVEGQISISPMSLLSEPSAELLEQVEEVAGEALLEVDPKRGLILIPIIFIYDEVGISGMFDPVQLRRIYRPVIVGDAFAAAMMAKHDRRRVKQNVRELLRRADSQIQDITQVLTTRGLDVSRTRILAFINRLDNTVQQKYLYSGLEDRLCVLGYFGLEDGPIPEEGESDSGNHSPLDHNKLRASSGGNIINKVQQERRGSQSVNASRVSVTSRECSTLLTSSSAMLSRSQLKTNGGNYRPGDITASIISINKANDAVNFVTSRLEELQSKTTEPEQKKFSKFILTDLIFLSFLFSRTFCYITDSVVFAHLSNFGLYLGFTPEKASSLLTYVGITAMLGRLVNGFIGQFVPKMDIRTYISACMLILSTGMIIAPFYPTEPVLSAFAILYGFLISPSPAFAPGLTYQIVGPERYDEGISFLFQFEAVGFLIGGPVGGIIKEINGRYPECFVFGAICGFACGFILIFQTLWDSPPLRKCLSKTKDDDDAEITYVVEDNVVDERDRSP